MTFEPSRVLDWVSQLPSTAAPGLVYLAGACRGVPVGGGLTLAEADLRLAGEAAEVLAQTDAPVPSDAPAFPGSPRPAASRWSAPSRATATAAGWPSASRRRRTWQRRRPVPCSS